MQPHGLAAERSVQDPAGTGEAGARPIARRYSRGRVVAIEGRSMDLQEGANLVRVILEAVPGGVVQVATDGSIVEANSEALRILGHHFDDLTQRYIADFDMQTLRDDG